MTAHQINATARNPNGLHLTRVACYERTIRASVERVWENVLDWAHLPHLHASSFGTIELDAAGAWGWRVFSNQERTNTIELVVADERSYVSRSYSSGIQNAEIWTHLSPQGGATNIIVEFDIPDVPAENKADVGARMLELYSRLWDEDESMMIERTRRLNESRSRERVMDLGNREALNLPVRFQLSGREYRLQEANGKLQALPTICPHLLGPLAEGTVEDGIMTCPWHGYRFEIASGECIWPPDARCRLPPSPEVDVVDNHIIVRS